MANEQNPRNRARQSLEALKLAGIEFVPRVVASSPAPRPAAPPAEPPSTVGETESSATSVDSGPAVTPEQRRLALQALAEQVSRCSRCPELCSTRTQTVFGVGPIDVDLCVIGEAPGADEDAQGEPFVGKAGQLLNDILKASGFARGEVYICNILKCRPPANRAPKPEESENCKEYLHRQLELVRPKFMAAFGGTAAQNLLQTTTAIGKLRGQFHKFRGIPLMVTYHPAYLLPHRNPAMKKEVWLDMQMLVKRMGRTIPEAYRKFVTES